MHTPESAALAGVTILALDPSTTVTGAAVVRFDGVGAPTLLAAAHFDGEEMYRQARRGRQESAGGRRLPADTTDEKRVARIRLTRSAFGSWLNRVTCGGPALADGYTVPHEGVAIDQVAYEEPNQRGAGATSGLHQSIGALLTAGALAGLPVMPVHSSTAKAVFGAQKVRARGQTAADLDEKGRACEWARQTFLGQGHGRPFVGPGGEAEADACAVAVAAHRKLMLAALPGKGGPGGRARAKAPVRPRRQAPARGAQA